MLAVSPVRIDLAGGWSDTPPICYEMSGAVLNVAVTVDSKHPIRCASRFINSGSSLRLVTVRDLQDSATDAGTKGFEIPYHTRCSNCFQGYADMVLIASRSAHCTESGRHQSTRYHHIGQLENLSLFGHFLWIGDRVHLHSTCWYVVCITLQNTFLLLNAMHTHTLR